MSDFDISVSDDGSAGSKVKAHIQILSLNICYRVNDIPTLELKLVDRYIPDKDTFELADKKIFEIGKIISVTSVDKKVALFKGIITGVGIGVGADGEVFHHITAHGDIVKMTEGKITTLFKAETTDEDIIKKLMTDAGVKLGKIAAGKFPHHQYFCFQQSPWRVMMARTIANGAVFSPEVEANNIVDLQTFKAEKVTLNLNRSEVRHFYLHTDARSQIKKVSASTWSIEKQELDKDVTGDLAGYKTIKDVDKVMATPDLTLFANIPKSPDELKAEATAQNNYRAIDLYSGEISLVIQPQSSAPTIALMNQISLAGAGKEFAGDYMVTAITHRTYQGQWMMDITLGLSLRQTLQSDYANLSPLPIVVGKVMKYEEDKSENLQRIPVKLPAITGEEKIWARLLSPFASNEEGVFFPPNEDDEVMVGFIDGDCRYPVILGSTHNSKQKPPGKFGPDEVNQGIFIKNEDKLINLSFDKKNTSMSLIAGEETKAILSDEAGVSVEKGESNIAISKAINIISADPLALECERDIALTSKAKFIISATSTEIE
ncbi:phage baseplate assembly protein V [Agarilytica rhodophyticola]|uniref:phage baseplate assembly protein V n=1 Tax=Agarilytica rhodophyticola TaxID=1737490 RepID=UPI000B3445BE|nr:phage baseplate assembly protein V [Agarilytica rhodophyticola]